MLIESPASKYLKKYSLENKDNIHGYEGHISERFGFLSPEIPIIKLPEMYKAWDHYADNLPTYIENLSIINKIEEMPILCADSESLPNNYLLRASVVIKSLAHAYYYTKTTCYGYTREEIKLPAQVEIPWKNITQRLRRASVGRNVTDDFLYNWKLIDPKLPRIYENMQLMVPYFQTKAERRMTLAVIAMEASFGPCIEAILNAQDSILNNDNGKLKIELNNLIKSLRKICQILYYINPREYTESYVDPVLWARTFGRISGSWYPGEHGNSGAQSPMFHTMDAFIGRFTYQGKAATEILKHYNALPENHKLFIEKIRECITLNSYISEQHDEELNSLFKALLNEYCGEYGILGYHRHKIFGIISLAVADGRQETNNSRMTHDSFLHEQIDSKLSNGIQERIIINISEWDRFEIFSVKDNVVRIAINNTGLLSEPGDYLEILPENNNAYIDSFLNLMQLDAKKLIKINDKWKMTLASYGYHNIDTIPANIFFKYTDIKALIDEFSCDIDGIHNAKHNDKNIFNFVNILNRIYGKNNENPSQTTSIYEHGQENVHSCLSIIKEFSNSLQLSNIFQPLLPRKYSIVREDSKFLEILVNEVGCNSTLQYKNKSHGITSQMLLEASIGLEIRARVCPARHFKMPIDHKIPIVMFASGSGVSPFVGFIENRGREINYGKMMLIISTNQMQFHYKKLLENYSNNHKLDVIFVNTRDSTIESYIEKKFQQYHYDNESIRVNKLFESKSFNEQLQSLIFLNKAHVYVCGNSGFAANIGEHIKSRFEKVLVGNNTNEMNIFFAQRYHEDTYDTTSELRSKKWFFPSEIKYYNMTKDQIYTVINNKVYNLSDYLNKHPGGSKVLLLHAGLDATNDFIQVNHDKQSEVMNKLKGMEIGSIKFSSIKAEIKPFYDITIKIIDELTKIENTYHNGIDFIDDSISPYLKYQNLFTIVDRYRHVIGKFHNNLALVSKGEASKIVENLSKVAFCLLIHSGSETFDKISQITMRLKDFSVCKYPNIDLEILINTNFESFFISSMNKIKRELIFITYRIEADQEINIAFDSVLLNLDTIINKLNEAVNISYNNITSLDTNSPTVGSSHTQMNQNILQLQEYSINCPFHTGSGSFESNQAMATTSKSTTPEFSSKKEIQYGYMDMKKFTMFKSQNRQNKVEELCLNKEQAFGQSYNS